MQLWQGPRGCIVTEIVVYPRKKVLNLFLAGGELDQIVDMNDDITAGVQMAAHWNDVWTNRLEKSIRTVRMETNVYDFSEGS